MILARVTHRGSPPGSPERRQRRESAHGWIASGATVTIKTYARRDGVDHYTAYEDLTALGHPLPASARSY